MTSRKSALGWAEHGSSPEHLRPGSDARGLLERARPVGRAVARGTVVAGGARAQVAAATGSVAPAGDVEQRGRPVQRGPIRQARGIAGQRVYPANNGGGDTRAAEHQ